MNIELKNHIGNTLKKLRESAKMSKVTLAKKIGTTPTHIAGIENGHYLPSLSTLEKFCDLFNIKSSDILPF